MFHISRFSICAVFISFLLGCGAPPVMTQKLDIASGEVAIPGEVRVNAINFIRFDDDAARFDRSASLLAERWLNQRRSDADSYLREFVGEFSRQIALSLETEIRRRKCIYTVEPTSAEFLDSINRDIASSRLTAPDLVFEEATDEELEKLDRLTDEEFEVEFARLLAKYGLEEGQGENKSKAVAVASQCLLDVHVGDTLSAFKFSDRLAISRQFGPEET